MKKSLLSILGLFVFNCSIAQNITQNRIFSCEKVKKANDLETVLNADKTYKVTLLCSPEGAGNKREVQSGSNSKYYFEEEHNVVWVKFTAIKKSRLAITITPNSAEDDYDFLLFKDEGERTQQKIRSKQLKPIRTNIARTKNINNGITGLQFEAKKTHVSQGVQDVYSEYINVEKDESYYLVLDNVYDGGEGAVIVLDYFKTKVIEGVVEDSEQKPIEAEVVWENSTTGEEIVKTRSDSVTGAFEIEVPFSMNPSNKYVLSTYSDKHIFSETSYTPAEIASCDPAPIKVILPNLAKGKRTKLHNINFVGDQAVFLKGATPTLKRLARLMKKNPLLVIHIEGHTNGCSKGQSFSQTLSENRAIAVEDYLVLKGISTSRVSTEGLNCKYLLYAVDSSPEKQSLNRRVEIIVKDY